jgi:type III secretion protein D
MLSGLHRGAAMEISEEELLVGAANDADIMLADPGVAPAHLRIVKRGETIGVLPAEGEVYDEHGRRLEGTIDVVPGQRFRIGDIWIGFFDNSATWDDVLPSAIMPSLPDQMLPATLIESASSLAADGSDAAGAPDGAADAAAAAAEAGTDEAPAKKRAWHRRKLGIAVLALAVTLVACWIAIAIYMNYRESSLQAAQAARRARELEQARPHTPAEFEATLKRMLGERDLADRVDLKMEPHLWELRGNLDADEQERARRMIEAFNKRYLPPFLLQLNQVPQSEMLPFRIVQITTGKRGNIVTERGQRVFVGDVLDGYRLVSVERARIVFAGKRRVEVVW